MKFIRLIYRREDRRDESVNEIRSRTTSILQTSTSHSHRVRWAIAQEGRMREERMVVRMMAERADITQRAPITTLHISLIRDPQITGDRE